MTVERLTTASGRVVRVTRSVPTRFWVVAIVWCLAVWAFAVGSSRFGLVDPLLGNAFTQVALSVAEALWPVIIVASAVAPVVGLVRPWLATGLAASGLVLVPPTHQPPAIMFATFLAVLGVAISAVWSRPRVALIIAALSLVVPVALSLGVLVLMPGGSLDSASWDLSRRIIVPVLYAAAVAMVLAVAWALRSTLRTAQARVELDARTHDVANEATAVTERARIARDLHDVVAHRISLIAVRAETAPYTHPELSDEARQLLSDTATDARAALEEMREVLGVLHRTADAPARAPQPGAGDIVDIVAEARAAGAHVEVDGEVPVMTGPVGNTAYRVVQEALTNARRHAPDRPAIISFDRQGSDIILSVTNPAPDGMITFGRGLTGMRERVELAGGHLTVERSNGRFTVQARFPGANA